MEYTNEMIEKAKAAESAEALQALAGENNIEMSAEEAESYFAELHPKSGELSDDELENVAGGGCRHNGDLIVTAISTCDRWICREYKIKTQYARIGIGCTECNKKVCKEKMKICDKCFYCTYTGRLWLCKHPAR